MPRPVATSSDEYSLTVEDAAMRYEQAGHPRTIRAIQRYCANSHLDCLRQETRFGDRYLITPESVSRHIAQIAELADTTSRDLSRPTASDVAAPILTRSTTPATTRDDLSRQVAANVAQPAMDEIAPTSPDVSRPAATSDRYVARLEGEVEFLRGQITTKDLQIKELTERSRETNVLIGGLQRLLAPLLGSRDPHPPMHHDQTP